MNRSSYKSALLLTCTFLALVSQTETKGATPNLAENGLSNSGSNSTSANSVEVSLIAEKNLKDPLNPNLSIARQLLQLVGHTINASDILANMKGHLSKNDETGDIYEVRVYAMKQFIMNNDLNLPGVNLAILAPDWSIGKKETSETTDNMLFTIDLSGRHGKRPNVKPQMPTVSGKNGEDGAPGNPGESSGNLMIYGLSDEKAKQLKVVLNGGSGGNGQEAGDGSNGKAGVDPGEITKKLNLTPESTPARRENFGGFSALTIRYYRNVGCAGERGGNSGRPGAGGKEGNCGDFLISYTDDTNITRKDGSSGNPGQKGAAGKGGKGVVVGRAYLCFEQKPGVGTILGGILTLGLTSAVAGVANKRNDGWLEQFKYDEPVPQKVNKAFKFHNIEGKLDEFKNWLKSNQNAALTADDGSVLENESPAIESVKTQQLEPSEYVKEFQQHLIHLRCFEISQCNSNKDADPHLVDFKNQMEGLQNFKSSGNDEKAHAIRILSIIVQYNNKTIDFEKLKGKFVKIFAKIKKDQEAQHKEEENFKKAKIFSKKLGGELTNKIQMIGQKIETVQKAINIKIAEVEEAKDKLDDAIKRYKVLLGLKIALSIFQTGIKITSITFPLFNLINMLLEGVCNVVDDSFKEGKETPVLPFNAFDEFLSKATHTDSTTEIVGKIKGEIEKAKNIYTDVCNELKTVGSMHKEQEKLKESKQKLDAASLKMANTVKNFSELCAQMQSEIELFPNKSIPELIYDHTIFPMNLNENTTKFKSILMSLKIDTAVCKDMADMSKIFTGVIDIWKSTKKNQS